MKHKTIVVALAGLLAASRLMAGEPHEPKQESKLHAKVILVATSNAPAGARGHVHLEVETKKDHSKSKLKIHTDGLNGGDYVLSVVTQPDGSNVVLGPVTVKTNGHVEHDDLGALPSSLIVSNITQIVLSDSGGNAVLVGDLLEPQHEPKHDVKLHAKIILIATSNAPAGARGSVDLHTDAKNDHTKSKLKIKTDGLNGGDYVLSVITRSDGSNVVLGPITVKTDGHVEHKDQAALPSSLNVTNIAQIVLSDSGGNAVLVGDLVDPEDKTKIDHKVSVDIEPGPGAPDAKGKASISRMIYHGKIKERFSLKADHVPADATFQIIVDGVNVGQVISKHDGKVDVKKLPGVNLSTVQTVQLVDETNNVVLTANF